MKEEMEEIFNKLDEKGQQILNLVARGMLVVTENQEKGEK